MRRSARTALCRVLAFLPLLALVAGPLHHAAARHEVCPEHGEWLHEGVPRAAIPAAHAAHPESPLVAAATGIEAGSMHDVCGLALPQRELAGCCFDARPPALGLIGALDRAPVPSAIRVPAFARFLLAPCHSPPSV